MSVATMPAIAIHVSVQKNTHKNEPQRLNSIHSDYQFVLPKIRKPNHQRIYSERKPYSINPFPKRASGHGIYVFENKFFRYEGQWEKGEKHGFGKLLLQDGTYYEGQFTHGEITGHGFKYFASTKCTYKGQFLRGEMHGKGVLQYPDGAQYDGTFLHNKKNGYGVMKTKEPHQIYEGGFQGNLKHGSGYMIYSNGDRYEGHWEADKRHGHGILYFVDGSVYDGEFVMDEFSGRGIIRHISGVVYDGLWLNGFPAKMSSKLHIVVESTPLVIRQGIPFQIRVECRNEEDEVVVDEGREIQITAGFRYYQPKKGSALFDMIEDVEDKPIDTPFGYQVVHYPLTNMVDQEDPSEDDDKDDELLGSQTQLDALKVSDEEDEAPLGKEDNKEGENTENEKHEDEKGAEEGVDSGGGEEEPDENSAPSNTIEKESVPLPPPVPNQKTEGGVCVWNDIYLAPAPPMYRPFVAMVEAENENKKNSKPNKFRAVDKMKKQKEKSLEEKYARTGEYVLMVHDVTSPPFLNRTLEPAFLLLKLKRPEVKKKTTTEKKKLK